MTSWYSNMVINIQMAEVPEGYFLVFHVKGYGVQHEIFYLCHDFFYADPKRNKWAGQYNMCSG